MKFNVTIELELVSGPASDVETMLDAFAATIGRENTAKPALLVKTGYPVEDGGEGVTLYVVKLVDDVR